MRCAWLFVACVCLCASQAVGDESDQGSEPLLKVAEERNPTLKLAKARFTNKGLPAPRIDMGQLNRMNKLAPPNPRNWPEGFEVQFYTNVSSAREVAGAGPWPARAVKGTLWFGDQRGQRVLHAAGSAECQTFYHVDSECTLVFNRQGLHALLPQSDASGAPAPQRCCLDMPGLPAPAANWTTAAPHEWFKTKHIRGRLCHGFLYRAAAGARLPGRPLPSAALDQALGHEYWEDAATGLPCAFAFPGASRQDFYFDLDSFRPGAQPPGIFSVPGSCSDRCEPAAAGGAPDGRGEAGERGRGDWRQGVFAEAAADASALGRAMEAREQQAAIAAGGGR
jgi:hypothetical protein